MTGPEFWLAFGVGAATVPLVALSLLVAAVAIFGPDEVRSWLGSGAQRVAKACEPEAGEAIRALRRSYNGRYWR